MKASIEDITPAIKSAVNAVLMARTLAEYEREKIDAMERDILNTATYRVDEKWLERGRPERILEPKQSYLMSKTDFDDYHAECQFRIKKMGYKIPEGYCPALMAESFLLKTERLLIESAEPIFKVSVDQLLCAGLEKYRKYIDLLCGLVVNLPDFRNPLDRKPYKKTLTSVIGNASI